MTAPFELIPVLDLMRGAVVRGMQGDRASYRPIVSALCGSSEPLAVARCLLQHTGGHRLYVADLDALGVDHAAQFGLLRELLAALPQLELWLDAGFGDAASLQRLQAQFGADAARIVPVVGSESLRAPADLQALFGSADAPGPLRERGVLSLDRRGAQRLDAAGAWDATAHWPRRVIVMTLERVGSGAGPELATLRALRQRAPQVEWFGAGGIRDAADLQAAAAAGAAGWLVASALHDRRLVAP